MKGIKLYSIFAFLVALAGILYYVFSEREREKENNEYRQNQEFKAGLESARMDIYLKNYQEAEEELRKLLDKYPNEISIKTDLANLLSWEGKYSEAVSLYEQLLKQDPDNIQIRRHYARVLMWMGRFQDSADEMKKTISSPLDSSSKSLDDKAIREAR